MNRRQKIIVSVVGIFIVLLALVGITYGYFLTRIQGNTNTTSISVTTADLALVYDGDDGSIIGNGEVIVPDKTFATKTFTVENKGNTTIDSYAVILDDVSITDATTGEAKSLLSTRDGYDNDFDLVITCNNGDCNGYSAELPEENAILVTNSIEPGEIHTYSATLKYVETNDDQSDDMNKRITGKFNIIDTSDTAIIEGKVTNTTKTQYYVQTNSTKRVSYIDSEGNYKILGLEAGPHTIKLCEITDLNCADPKLTRSINIQVGSTSSSNDSTGTIIVNNNYNSANITINADSETVQIEDIEFSNPYVKDTLAYKIVDSALNATSDKTLLSAPITIPGQQISDATEKVLANTKDNYGISYYYRGNVQDNYLAFAGMCWRIVRVQGDGSVKLILASQGECNNSLTSDSGYIGFASYGYSEVDNKIIANFLNSNDSITSNDSYQASTTSNGLMDTLSAFYSGGSITETATSFTLSFDGFDTTEQNYIKLDKWYKGDVTKAYNNSSPYSLLGKAPSTLINEGNTFFYYNNRANLKSNKLDLINTDEVYLKMPIGLLTSDEVAFAGGKYSSSNSSFYLNANAVDAGWWTMSMASFGDYLPGTQTVNPKDFVFSVTPSGKVAEGVSGGGLYNSNVDNYEVKVRPSIILKNTTKFDTGTGTSTDPYRIK